jgi:hypothetical protein
MWIFFHHCFHCYAGQCLALHTKVSSGQWEMGAVVLAANPRVVLRPYHSANGTLKFELNGTTGCRKPLEWQQFCAGEKDTHSISLTLFLFQLSLLPSPPQPRFIFFLTPLYFCDNFYTSILIIWVTMKTCSPFLSLPQC